MEEDPVDTMLRQLKPLNHVQGIPTDLKSDKAIRVLDSVLCQIHKVQPTDYERLKRVVLFVASLGAKPASDGTTGHWITKQARGDDPETWGYGYHETPGILRTIESKDEPWLTANLAHELGHACTVREDLLDRGDCPEGEWRSESTADWYAVCRWGFKTEMEQARKSRSFHHHGPWPGCMFEFSGTKFKVDEYFRFHYLDSNE